MNQVRRERVQLRNPPPPAIPQSSGSILNLRSSPLIEPCYESMSDVQQGAHQESTFESLAAYLASTAESTPPQAFTLQNVELRVISRRCRTRKPRQKEGTAPTPAVKLVYLVMTEDSAPMRTEVELVADDTSSSFGDLESLDVGDLVTGLTFLAVTFLAAAQKKKFKFDRSITVQSIIFRSSFRTTELADSTSEKTADKTVEKTAAPDNEAETQLLTCSICHITANSVDQAREHYSGQKHATMLARSLVVSLPESRKTKRQAPASEPAAAHTFLSGFVPGAATQSKSKASMTGWELSHQTRTGKR